MALVEVEKSKPNFVKEREKGKAEKFEQVMLGKSGIKIREAAAKLMGISKGDKVWFAADKEGDKTVGVAIYKTNEGETNGYAVGAGLVFSGKDVKNALLAAAGITEAELHPKKGKIFNVGKTPIDFKGHQAYMLTLASQEEQDAQEEEQEDEVEAQESPVLDLSTEEEED